MNTRILNRAGKLPDDGFYQIEALGEHINHAARVVQVIDATAVDSIVNRFASEAAKAGADFCGLRIDRDHLSQSMENPTESLGWTMQLRNREGVPEAKIAWTALGRPLIESKEDQPPVYKFFSTEYDPAQCQKIGTRSVNRKTYDLVRPLRLDGLSLTNDPNNKGQRPISNRNGNPADAADENQKPTMKSLLKQLGVAEDASEESAVAALQVISNRATKAEAAVTTLTTERDALLASQVEVDLSKYAKVIKNRETWKKQLLMNRAGTIELLEALSEPAAAGAPRITNRTTATPPDGVSDDKAGNTAVALAQKILNRAQQIQKEKSTRGRSYPFATAHNEATGEFADQK